MADYLHSDLGHLRRGSVVVVTLSGNQANVRLMEGEDFRSYRAGRQHTFLGGRATQSPVRLRVPRDGWWHAVVDMQGLSGSVNAGIVVEPPPLGEAPQGPATPAARSPFGPIADNLAAVAPESPALRKPYDVFIAHEAADRRTAVAGLVGALRSQDLEVWYEGFALRAGDDYRRRLDAGLTASRFGVIVLSPGLFALPWPREVLDTLVTRTLAGERQVILPVWHTVSRRDVAGRSTALAGCTSVSMEKFSAREIGGQIAAAIRGE